MLHKPQFLEDSDRYRKANGETVTLSVVVRKVYEGLTDRLPEKIHDRLKIALVHDRVQIEGDKYVGIVTQEGDYQIDWQDFLSHPLAQAKFKAEVTPFNATNSNCGTCQEMIQVVAVDDNLGTLNEDQNVTFNPLSNDSICCNPVQISLVTTNGTFIENVTINPATNEISFHVKDPVQEATDIVILSYRVQCQNGQYDDANVIASINGSIPATCDAPTNLITVDITYSTADIAWDDVSGAERYDWQLYLLSDLVHPVQYNSTMITEALCSGLTPATQYRFYVLAHCPSGDSGSAYIDFTTESSPGNEFCGSYHLLSAALGLRNVSYTDCNANTQNIFLPPLSETDICALQSAPGVPINLITGSGVIVTYNGLC